MSTYALLFRVEVRGMLRVVLMTATVEMLGKLCRSLCVGKTLAMTMLLVPDSVLVNLRVNACACENRRGRNSIWTMECGHWCWVVLSSVSTLAGRRVQLLIIAMLPLLLCTRNWCEVLRNAEVVRVVVLGAMFNSTVVRTVVAVPCVPRTFGTVRSIGNVRLVLL